MTIKKEEEKKDKTLYYMIETINVLVENQKILLNRIKKLEGQHDMITGEIFGEDEDEDEDRIIN